MAYRDRHEAGETLARELDYFRGRDPIVLAIPRGGVPVGAVVRQGLGGTLEVVLTSQITAPSNPDLTIGAVTIDGQLLLDPAIQQQALTMPPPRLMGTIAAAQVEMAQLRRLYVGKRHFPDLTDRITILVDDGCSSGFSLMAALRWINRQAPELLILALPVAPRSVLKQLSLWCDRLVCPEQLLLEQSVKDVYAIHEAITDQEVQRLLFANSEG